MKVISWLHHEETELKDALKNIGLQYISCSDKKDFDLLTAKHNNTVSLIIIESALPGIDIYSFCKEIKSNELLHSMLMVIGSNRESEMEIEVLESGADFCVHRPLKMTPLLMRIQSALFRK
jgi:DNA-binding response OmpR family regulator